LIFYYIIANVLIRVFCKKLLLFILNINYKYGGGKRVENLEFESLVPTSEMDENKKTFIEALR